MGVQPMFGNVFAFAWLFLGFDFDFGASLF